jgi:hypothetical protein
MDELTSSYGQLSTTAKEWKPLRQSPSTSTSSSVNNATSLSPSTPINQRPVSSVLHQSPPGKSPGVSRQSSLPVRDSGHVQSQNYWNSGAHISSEKSWNNAPIAPFQQAQGSWGQGSDGKFCYQYSFLVCLT